MSPPEPGAQPAPPADSLSAAGEATVISSQVTVGRSLPGRSVGIPTANGTAPVREVGRYQILEKLGEGAMATVYKAHDSAIDRPLAIKLLHAELCHLSEYRMCFLREGKAASMLTHPNVVTVFDAGVIDGRPYLTMPLLNGAPLSQSVSGGQHLPVREVLDIGIQLAGALDYAHGKGIVHRDVKPSNVIRLSGSGTVKLADFGIAHVPAVDDASHPGAVMGTPRYMSPEQAAGRQIDARSDLWGLGVVLYQLVSGKQPFEADTFATLLYRIANAPPKPVAMLRRDVPPGLCRIIARCLNKQPGSRFQSGRELAVALIKVRHDIDAESARARARPRHRDRGQCREERLPRLQRSRRAACCG